MTLIRMALLGLVVFAAACQVVPVEGERPAGATEAEHNCIDACDHIYADGGWLVIRGHRHGPNCGHVKVDGKWVKEAGSADPLKTPKEQN